MIMTGRSRGISRRFADEFKVAVFAKSVDREVASHDRCGSVNLENVVGFVEVLLTA